MAVPQVIGWVGLASLLGCTPVTLNPVLKPTQPIVRWVHGEGFVEMEKDGLTVGVAFRRAGVNGFEFSVDVQNGSAAPVDISPERFQCEMSGILRGTTDSRVVSAEDPERQLRQLEAAKAIEKKAQADTSHIQGLFFLLDISDSVSNATRRTREEKHRVMEDKRKTYDRLDLDKQHAEEREARLAAEQRERETVSLRKHTLEPGKRLQGRVEFHMDATAHRKFRLWIPVGERAFEFFFESAA